MVESNSSPPNPRSPVATQPSTTDNLPPSTVTGGGGGLLALPGRRPGIRVTSEFDSERSVFFHKISCKLLDNLAKLKLSFSFHNDEKGDISDPQLGLTSNHLSVHYDLQDHNALLKGSFDLAPGLHLEASHEPKAQQGEVELVADLAGPAYKLTVSSAVPSTSLPRAALKFPFGEVSFEEREEEEEEAKRMLSVNGILKGHILNGVCAAEYQDESLSLRYSYKDEQMTFIPRISMPSNALSFAFKRQFSPSDKLSYWYNFDLSSWSAVYKHTVGKDFKFKAGYDSEVRLVWASLWVGDEDGKAKTAPMKMKAQLMLQVPQDDIKSAAVLFHVKKRWDF